MKISRIMSISKLLTDLCAIRQKARINKNKYCLQCLFYCLFRNKW